MELSGNRNGAVFSQANWTQGNNNSVPLLTTPVLFEISFDSALATDNYQFFVYGVPTGTRTDNTLWVPKEGYGPTLGVQGAADTAGAGVFTNDAFFSQGNWVNSFSGQFGEFVLYDEALTGNEADWIRHDLLLKWLNIDFPVAAAVPEPSTFGLGLMAVVGFVLLAKRRRSR